MKSVQYQTLSGNSAGYYLLLVALAAVAAIGYGAAHYMDVNGHHVTGMSNQVVWGTPHVFAVFLIVAASGAINMASVGSVFGKTAYKPLGRLSALLAAVLLIGGLLVLVLDLGRPDRLIVAMTTYNPRSIFAWNILLYTGFLGVIAVYIWMMMERRFNQFSKWAGLAAFIWRLVLTIGTGSIFGFLVARDAYDTAILAPTFIAMSLSFGTAIFLLLLLALYRVADKAVPAPLLRRYADLLGVFVATVLLLVAVYHLTNLYMTGKQGFESFVLLDGGVYTFAFWVVQVLLGSLVPLALLYLQPFRQATWSVVVAAVMVLVGALGQLYVLIIGGQAFPMPIFPGMDVSSSYFDGVVASYAPSLPEVLLGTGGLAAALLIALLAMKVLPFLPVSLADVEA